ncbi:MAG: hypothetical protein N2558_03220 [Patescibacteria group bacterium]|nr:hypothetical protein [Patescibacteria group bacterium]
MFGGLSARQTNILKALIDEYIQTAEPVGSESLERKYNLGVSPATIRNEMAYLTRIGYLQQPHASAGRIPLPPAIKFYISQLMEEKQMSIAEEVKVKENVWSVREDFNEVLEKVTYMLSVITKNLAVATAFPNKKLWCWGHSSVLQNPEFDDISLTASLFSCVEQVEFLQELFFEHMTGSTPVEVVFGEDLGRPDFNRVAVVGTRLVFEDKQVGFGVIGPVRLEYQEVIPKVKYVQNLLGEILEYER